VIELRQARAELGPGPAFDAGDEQAQHIVKDLDLIAVETLSLIQQEICHLSNGVNPSLPRATPHGVFEFVDDGMNRLLHCRSGGPASDPQQWPPCPTLALMQPSVEIRDARSRRTDGPTMPRPGWVPRMARTSVME